MCRSRKSRQRCSTTRWWTTTHTRGTSSSGSTCRRSRARRTTRGVRSRTMASAGSSGSAGCSGRRTAAPRCRCARRRRRRGATTGRATTSLTPSASSRPARHGRGPSQSPTGASTTKPRRCFAGPSRTRSQRRPSWTTTPHTHPPNPVKGNCTSTHGRRTRRRARSGACGRPRASLRTRNGGPTTRPRRCMRNTGYPASTGRSSASRRRRLSAPGLSPTPLAGLGMVMTMHQRTMRTRRRKHPTRMSPQSKGAQRFPVNHRGSSPVRDRGSHAA
mmetsp:Transcript_65157/g.149221  ORF Transcript_65157/g.149221 Transcript_65157/m.149221 type:complete len:274 (+) Transcript_65157:389-1210(+)